MLYFTPKWPLMLLDFNLFLCIDFRPKASLLLYFYIFCTCNITDCPTLEIYKYIYKCIKSIYIYEHKADFYFNKVPLHAAVFPLFFPQKEAFAGSVIIYVDHRVWISWSLSLTHVVCVCECFLGFPACFFSWVFVSLLGLHYLQDTYWRGWGHVAN